MGFILNSMLNPMPQVDLDPQTVLADYELAISSSGTLSQPSGHALLFVDTCVISNKLC